MSDLALPSHIKTILITGAGGFVGRELVQLLIKVRPDLALVTTDIKPPPTYGIQDANKLIAVGCDLGDRTQVEGLFKGRRIQGVFALQ